MEHSQDRMKEQPLKKKRNLYLIGMMGTGKSAVGRIASEKLGLSYLDSDHVIETQTGISVQEIFTRFGENKFRKLEESFVKEGHDPDGNLVSCGGGLCIAAGMLERIKTMGLVICLWANPETILTRTRSDSNRPLLQVESPLAEIKRILAERESRYLSAHKVLSTENRSIEQVAQLVVEYYLEQAH